MKKLLAVIDMQKDFVFGALGTKEAQAILPAVKTEIENARAEGLEIVFTRDTHGEDYLTTQEGRNLPVTHCVKETDGWQIVEGLRRDEQVFDKPVFGSELLAEYVKEEGFDEVTLIGVCTDICVVSNALLMKAKCPETKVRVVEKACAGVTPETHRSALVTMKSCQVEVV